MKTGTKFTPGPWTFGREDYAYFEHGGMTLKNKTVGIDGANGDEDFCRIVIGDPSGEGVANARLIASCPELVAAGKRALPWLGKLIADGGHLNSVAPNDALGAMQQLQAALEKAGAL